MKNLTAELFLNGFAADSDIYKQLDPLYQRMRKHRQIILPARNKLGSHADRDVIRKGKPLAAASWTEWDEFWVALEQFVNILNRATSGKPFEINAAGVLGDAESLLKAFRQSGHFDTLIQSKNSAVQDAVLSLISSHSEGEHDIQRVDERGSKTCR